MYLVTVDYDFPGQLFNCPTIEKTGNVKTKKKYMSKYVHNHFVNP